MKNYVLVSLILTTAVCASDNITIRYARIDELDQALSFDREVTFEFFKPLYLEFYADFPNGKNPDGFLNEELAEDREFFRKAIVQEDSSRLLIAEDNNQKAIVGLLLFHKEELLKQLDFLVDNRYRTRGVGKTLVRTSFRCLEDVTSCIKKEKSRRVGFKEEQTMQLDLLLVHKSYRNKGAGKKLVKTSLTCFEDVTSCVVYPLRFGNTQTLKFYESLGFVNYGVGPIEKINAYGVSFSEMQYYYRLDVTKF